jgi:HAD superfamily hydrolase (TIGR01509 family)
VIPLSNMIKAVVFDLGKVLLDFDYSIAVRKIAARGTLAIQDLARLVVQEPLLIHYETGLLTTENFYQQVCAATGYGGTLEEFASAFGDIFTPIEPMIALHDSLRRRGCATFIFSNTNDLAIRHVRRAFPFFKNFDGYIFSYEHGAMKPDPQLYAVVEKQTGAKGAQLLYIDDRPENIAAGADRGWRVILQESPEKTHSAVAQSGLLGDV